MFTNRWSYVYMWIYSHQLKIRELKSLSSRFNSLMLSRLIVVDVLLLQVVEAYLNEHRSCAHIVRTCTRRLFLLKSNYAREKRKKVSPNDDDRYRCIDLSFFSFIQWHLTIWSNWVTRDGGKTFDNNRKNQPLRSFIWLIWCNSTQWEIPPFIFESDKVIQANCQIIVLESVQNKSGR